MRSQRMDILHCGEVTHSVFYMSGASIPMFDTAQKSNDTGPDSHKARVLRAIGATATTGRDISDKTGIDRVEVNQLLRVLLEGGYVTEEGVPARWSTVRQVDKGGSALSPTTIVVVDFGSPRMNTERCEILAKVYAYVKAGLVHEVWVYGPTFSVIDCTDPLASKYRVFSSTGCADMQIAWDLSARVARAEAGSLSFYVKLYGPRPIQKFRYIQGAIRTEGHVFKVVEDWATLRDLIE